MQADFGGVAFREFNIVSPDSWVLTAFYNCGPGYTDGKRNPDATGDDARNARVYYFEHSDGNRVPSKMDYICRLHGAETGDAVGKPNE